MKSVKQQQKQKQTKIDESYLKRFMNQLDIKPEFLTERNLKNLNTKSSELRKQLTNKKTFNYNVNNINDLLHLCLQLKKNFQHLGNIWS